MTQIREVQFRVAASTDVAAMAHCRLSDPAAGPADERMLAYFNGQHHPQQALLPRVGYVAHVAGSIVGYVAGHLTIRHACAGEVQYLFVAPAYRRRGVATSLLRLLAGWFREQRATKVCVCVDADSPAALPFYESLGASPFKKYWYAWKDIGVLLD
jgi:GNAT superfamily N-acetyltransferase